MDKVNYVYLLTDPGGTKYKVGFTNDIKQRLANLQTGSSHELLIYSLIECPSTRVARAVEKHIKRKLKDNRIKDAGDEWYTMRESTAYVVVFETTVKDNERHSWNLKKLM